MLKEHQEILVQEKQSSIKGFMKAVRIHKYGSSDILTYENAPIPEILPDEVLIRVHAAAVNPVDWKIREGYMKENIKHRFPLIPGWDVAGTVEDTGGLATIFNKGDTVIAKTDTSRDGSYAEY